MALNDYWPILHWSTMNSLHKCAILWRFDVLFSFLTWTSWWTNSPYAVHLRLAIFIEAFVDLHGPHRNHILPNMANSTHLMYLHYIAADFRQYHGCGFTRSLQSQGPLFSCDQAALWTIQSVCPSVCLCVRHTFLAMFPSLYHHEVFRSYYQWHK